MLICVRVCRWLVDGWFVVVVGWRWTGWKMEKKKKKMKKMREKKETRTLQLLHLDYF